MPLHFDWISKIHQLSTQERSFALVTLIATAGSTPRESSTKMIVLPDGEFFGTVGGGQFELQLRERALAQLNDSTQGPIQVHTFPLGAKSGQCCGGVIEALIEVMNPKERLYIIGAGHVALAVSKIMQETPYRPIAIDSRHEWCQKMKDLGGEVIEQDPLQFVKEHHFCEQDNVAIMTHSHDLDLDLVEILCQKNLNYLGLIGSQSKWLQFKQRLAQRNIPPADLEKVNCPLGLPIGGKSPQEVAISLAAQLLRRFYERQ